MLLAGRARNAPIMRCFWAWSQSEVFRCYFNLLISGVNIWDTRCFCISNIYFFLRNSIHCGRHPHTRIAFICQHWFRKLHVAWVYPVYNMNSIPNLLNSTIFCTNMEINARNFVQNLAFQMVFHQYNCYISGKLFDSALICDETFRGLFCHTFGL